MTGPRTVDGVVLSAPPWETNKAPTISSTNKVDTGGGGGASQQSASQAAPSSTAPIVTRFGTVPNSVASVLRKYFKPADLVKAAEVSYMESGWSNTAVNDTTGKAGGELNVPYVTGGGINAFTEKSVGLFQINVGAHGGTVGQWENPDANAAKAAQLLYGGQGWNAWKVSAGRLGLTGSGQPVLGTVPNTASGAASPSSAQRAAASLKGPTNSNILAGKAAQGAGSTQSQAQAPSGTRVLDTPLGPVTIPTPGDAFKRSAFFLGSAIVVIVAINALVGQRLFGAAKQAAKSPVGKAAIGLVPGGGEVQLGKAIAQAVKK